MPSEFWMKVGDLLPPLAVVLKNQVGAVENLTSATKVEIRLKFPDGTVAVKTATVTDAVAGAVAYTWQLGDTSQAGDLELEFIATIDGKLKTFPSASYARVQIVEILS